MSGNGSMRKRICLILLGFVLVFFLSIGVDRAAGRILNALGYFRAMPPGVTLEFNTSEFHSIATTSAQGLRNDLVVLPKPKNTIRLLAVGDSFTFGWGVGLEETWVKLLEQQLRERGNTAVEIINAGDPGIDLTLSRYICKAYKDQFDVDGILIGFYHDDIYQAAARSQSTELLMQIISNLWPTLMRINDAIVDPGIFGAGLPGEHIDLSLLWKKAAEEAIRRNPAILFKLDPRVRSDFISGKINPFLVFRSATDPGFLTYVLDDKAKQYAVDATRLRFKRIRESCSKLLPAAVLYLPSPSIVSETYHPYRKELGLQEDVRLIHVDMDRIFKNIIAGEDLTYLSVLSSFRHDGCPDCYYKYDGHLTATGHSRVVEAILPDFLRWFDAKVLRQ